MTKEQAIDILNKIQNGTASAAEKQLAAKAFATVSAHVNKTMGTR